MRWNDSFFNLRRFQKQMEKMFRDVSEKDIDVPAVDISETKNKVITKVDLPGIEKENINIKADEDSVEVNAERRRASEEKGEDFYRRERGYRSFYRQIPMPVKINAENIEAEYNNGVLKIKAEKKEKEKEEKKKKVKVK